MLWLLTLQPFVRAINGGAERLLDRLLLEAELHRGVHLTAQAPIRRFGQCRADVLER